MTVKSQEQEPHGDLCGRRLKIEGFQGKRRELEELHEESGRNITTGMGTKVRRLLVDKSAMQGLHLHQEALNHPYGKKKRVGKTQWLRAFQCRGAGRDQQLVGSSAGEAQSSYFPELQQTHCTKKCAHSRVCWGGHTASYGCMFWSDSIRSAHSHGLAQQRKTELFCPSGKAKTFPKSHSGVILVTVCIIYLGKIVILYMNKNAVINVEGEKSV